MSKKAILTAAFILQYRFMDSESEVVILNLNYQMLIQIKRIYSVHRVLDQD